MILLGNIYLNLYHSIEEHQRNNHKCFSAAQNWTLLQPKRLVSLDKTFLV
jgi:hypothetical protein